MNRLYVCYLAIFGISLLTCFFRDPLFKVFTILIVTVVMVPQNFINSLFSESGLSSQGLHPAFVSGIICLLLLVVQARKKLTLDFFAFAPGLLVFILPLLSTIFLRPSSEILGLVSNFYLALIIYFLVMYMNPKFLGAIIFRVIPILVYTEVFIAIIQFAGFTLPIYSEIPFNVAQHRNHIKFLRSSGSFDHPLILGLFLLAVLVVYSSQKTKNIGFLFTSAIVVGTLLTQSRTFIALVAFLILFNSMKARNSNLKFILFIALLLLLAFSLSRSILVDGIRGRYSNDYNSTSLRLQALDYVYRNPELFSLFGKGYGSSFESQISGAIGSSLESGWLMLAIDFGVLWIICFTVLLVNRIKPLESRTKFFCLILGASTFTFSSVAAPGPCLAILFMALALISTKSAQELASKNEQLL